MRPGSLQAWAIALRPRSFAVAASPVLVGTAYALWQCAVVPVPLAALALLCAVLMQAITNLQNDVGFHLRGGELGGQRQGLPRASSLGLITPRSLRRAIVVLSLLSLAAGLGLAAVRGWPVIALGLASLLGALAYMGGPRPIAYSPFGEFTVLVFFGWVAVLGTAWLLEAPLGLAAFLLASAVGCLAAAALAVNNHRDREHDSAIGRRTFAVMAGAQASARLYALLLGAPMVCLVGVALLTHSVWPLLPYVLAPRMARLAQDFRASAGGMAYNAILYRTFRLLLEFSLVLSLGLWCAATIR